MRILREAFENGLNVSPHDVAEILLFDKSNAVIPVHGFKLMFVIEIEFMRMGMIVIA